MKRLNKKGFTLVELLAVIVVLAIIMVIATQAIGNVIQKNTASSFKSSLDMITKQAKQAYVMDSGAATLKTFRELVDYDKSQYEIYFGTDAKTIAEETVSNSDATSVDLYYDVDDTTYEYKWICIKSKGTTASKFYNMKESVLKEVFGSESKYGFSSGVTVACKQFAN